MHAHYTYWLIIAYDGTWRTIWYESDLPIDHWHSRYAEFHQING